ncbi:hypothetical protein SAMN05216197_12463 [Pseudomonas graminis]|uniref:Uncharacterized protein n=1 Tax=Pseudomonas graminis TaxID=158627 RepID=A0A1I0GZA3_9PSED|nr:hypothetical protein SAMN05216197_12463 [Pseudomonas graminis]
MAKETHTLHLFGIKAWDSAQESINNFRIN